jgi:hypothetical protein
VPPLARFAPAAAAGVLGIGMAVIIAGVVVPGLFMPGVYLLVLGFLLLAAAATWLIVLDALRVRAAPPAAEAEPQSVSAEGTPAA